MYSPLISQSLSAMPASPLLAHLSVTESSAEIRVSLLACPGHSIPDLVIVGRGGPSRRLLPRPCDVVSAPPGRERLRMLGRHAERQVEQNVGLVRQAQHQ